VLLLDEPLSALDAKVRTQLRDEIRRIQLEVGSTTVFVTHDQEEALAVADRVGVMSNGRLDQIATPEELYNQPRTRFVAEFVGLTNRLEAKVDGKVATVLGARVPVLDGSVSDGAGVALVRPECLRVERRGTPNATLVSRSFLGPVSRVTCDLDGTGPVTAQLSSADATELVTGDRVRVTVSDSPVLVVAKD
jgi:putative spermidine/putrescine transport system ATP-binding protein